MKPDSILCYPVFVRDRLKNLENISNLRVTVRRKKGQNIFEFYQGDRQVFAAFTYKKAKTFAIGVAYGRSCAHP